MPSFKISHRYYLIINRIEHGVYPTFEDILEAVQDDGISDRTLRRSISELRDFGIEITYSEKYGGYYIDKGNSPDFDEVIQYLEIINSAGLLVDSLSDSKESLKYISIDTGGGLKGVEHLKPLLRAVRKSNKIKFTHYNFHKEEEKDITLKPYLLKEYQNRWYVVGLFPGGNNLITFGIERISNLKVLPETFSRDDSLDPKALFENAIGLVHSQHEPQKVVLSFTHAQGKYARTLPWHHSQKVIIDNKSEYRVSLFVSPNYELVQQILKHGETVKVLEPKWLKDEVKALLTRALAQY
ncbi:MAG: hypothetical protein C0593_02700 [Marinilabiliales bacterium]|nr:MAG: hypothetical protein C0593_02700 [Marinilabiliales bacterium]